MSYIIRQAKVRDLDLLNGIYTENMKSYVEINYSWNPHLFSNSFVPKDYQVIEIDKQTVGFMKIVCSTNEIYIAEIQIAKNFQRKGIRTSLLRLVIQEAQTNNQKLWLKVIKGNPAKKLYKRLGFIKREESSSHDIMVFTV